MIDLNYVHDLIVEEIAVFPILKNKAPALPKNSNHLYERIPLESIDKTFKNKYGIAVAGGEVSGGIECLDFDDHDKKHNIKDVIKNFCSNDFINSLIHSNQVYIQQTPSGGYHIIYRYDDENYHGSKVLAKWKNGDVKIETRGQGGYFIINPTPGYRIVCNSIIDLRSIDEEQRNLIIDLARSYDETEKSTQEPKEIESELNDPVSYYNFKKTQHAKNLLMDAGWQKVKEENDTEYWRRPGKDSGISATWGHRHNMFYVFSSNAKGFKTKCYYNPFQILMKLMFNNNFRNAINWIVNKYFKSEIPYIRVGIDYFKVITKTDRYGIERQEIKKWNKAEIIQDHGKSYVEKVPHFDDFTIEPDNFNYRQIVNGSWNLFKKFNHKPVKGEWPWTKTLLEHVFGEQYDLGIRYFQLLILYPKKQIPILSLVSKERSTGKTTVVNWLDMIFGANMLTISSSDLNNSFNSYAQANVIVIEETLIEKDVAVEKLKAISTAKTVTVNEKFVQPYKIPFYGKIIITSNNEDRFARIEDEEIRFFVRKLSKPTMKNTNIEDDLLREIPAFIHYLKSLPTPDFSISRSGFSVEELNNMALQNLKEESKHGLYFELKMLIESFFYEKDNIDSFYASAMDIKTRWFPLNNQYTLKYISKTLKNDFKYEQEFKRYTEFSNIEDPSITTKRGKVYKFERKDFIENEENNNAECPF